MTPPDLGSSDARARVAARAYMPERNVSPKMFGRPSALLDTVPEELKASWGRMRWTAS